MSVTKFVFCPLTLQKLHLAPIFLWLYAKYILCLLLPLQHPSLCSYIIRKQASELPNCQTQLLRYWRQPMPVFDKILTLLFLITDSWLGVLISWSVNLLWSPLHRLRIKATFLFPPNSVSFIFYSASVGRESQDFGQQCIHSRFLFNILSNPLS